MAGRRLSHNQARRVRALHQRHEDESRHDGSGPLFIHGTADDNVYFVHALRMSDALTRAGKAHEFVVLPGFTHMVTEPAMVEAMYGRMMGFFWEELGE